MRALVLSSGGTGGHYHIGALKYLYQEKAVKHEILCGNSIGAIICAYMTQYAYGQESFGVDRLSDLFLSLTDSDIYKRWKPFGVFQTFLGKQSLYNSAPTRLLLKTHLDQMKMVDSGKRLRVGVTLRNPYRDKDGRLSNYRVYNELDANIIDAIAASCALTPLFEPVRVGDRLGIDGGVQVVTPIKTAIIAGATDIDVLVCYPTTLTYAEGTSRTAIDAGLHTLNLMSNRLAWLDIERTREINTMISNGATANKRVVNLNVIHPETDLGVSALGFNPDTGAHLQKMGWEDAKLHSM